ncbi:adenylyltransferase/cytidyltransferase family protein [Flavobacteriaceae bacterium]|nr:adenylyltransferase/cytidyltransferase family protein [Flavobacteriaceae bacterium]
MSKPKAIIVSGYFNPLHKGHLELFEKAKVNGDQLWVIVNSDQQRALKGSKEFMDQDERLIIVNAVGIVDKALISIDKDKTQCATLSDLADKFSTEYELYFANGGDQNNDSISEISVCKEKGIGLIDGLGGKIQSSSWLLKK